jgi:hypothetical protein
MLGDTFAVANSLKAKKCVSMVIMLLLPLLLYVYAHAKNANFSFSLSTTFVVVCG